MRRLACAQIPQADVDQWVTMHMNCMRRPEHKAWSMQRLLRKAPLGYKGPG